MTAAAADRQDGYSGDRAVRRHDVAASVKIYKGTAVVTDSSGNARPGADTAGYKLAGVSLGDQINGTSTVDNTTGAAGDLTVDVYTRGVYEFVAAGLTKADVGKPCWLTDDQTIQLTPANVFAGVLIDFLSATRALVRIDAAVDNPPLDGRNLFVLQAFNPSTVGTTKVVIYNGLEMPRAFKVLRGYADCKTAPGSGYECEVEITDGTTAKTFVIDDTATHGEDEAIDQVYAANADIDIGLTDDNASAATADVSVLFVCEWL